MTLPDNVRHLPTAGRTDLVTVDDPGTELEPAPEVLEAELVEEVPPALDQPAAPIPVWSRRLPAPVQRAAASPVAGHAYVAAAGAGSWATRAWDSATLGTYRRQIRAHEQTGDSAGLALWLERREEAAGKRHARLLAAPKVVGALFGAAVVGVLGLAFLIVAVGLLAQVTGVASFGGLVGGVLGAVGVLLRLVLVAAVLALVAGPIVLVTLAHREGRKSGKAPSWMTAGRPDSDEPNAIVTPLGVAEAIVNLNIGPLKAAVKAGWQVAFDTPPMRINNRGYQAVFSLPMGVTPDMIANQRDVLARNLHRAPMEVWPVAADRPGYVELWVADAGSSTRPTPEYPLLHSGEADVFTGVPVGVTQRGDVLMAPIVGANGVAGGQMGQGKSNLCRVIFLGCATDPLADLWVHVFAGNGDFDAYRPRLARYHRGADDDTVWAGLESLRELYEETGRREARLAQIGAKKLTRGIAKQHPDLRPIVGLYSECHELFGSDLALYEGASKAETVGRAAAEYATKTIKRARKTGISLWFDTQSSRKEAIPPKLVELVGVNCCFSVKTWRSNDGFLGDGSFEAGIRATELRFNVDRGTCLVTGASDEVFEIVKTYFIAVDDDAGRDDAAPVIERVMATYESCGRPLLAATAPVEHRDLLEDVAAVLDGDEPIPVAEIPQRLRHLAPGWLPYQRLKGVDLRRLLDDEYGYQVPTTGNRYPVNPAAIRALVADRRALDEPEDDDE